MKHNQMRQVVFPILAAFIWGTAFVAQDMCADSIGAFAFNASRYFIAVLALLVVIVISDKLKKDKPVLSPAEKKAANRQLWLGGLCCGAALAMASNFQQAGMVAGTDSGKAGFITALYVVLVPVFGLFFRRKISLPVWIAVALSVLALYLLCIKGSFSLSPGDLLILISDKLKKDKPVLSPAEKKAANRQLWLGGLCCGAALAMASNFQQAGMVAGTDSGKAGFITALYVVLVPVFGLFFRRKISLPVWIAVALSVLALYLLCIKGSFSLSPGDLLILICAVCFAVHILVIDHFTAYCDGVRLSCLQFLFAGVISTVCMFLFEDVDFAAIWGCILPLLYVGIFSCGVGYTLQILAQKGSNPTVVTILLSLESVFAVIAGAIILKQQMSVREYIGCGVMFAAVLLAQIDFPVKQKAE